jgi:tyrosyl-tRNA synthetase
MKLSEELKWRGFVNQTTIKDLSMLDEQKLVFYFGVDPSSDSMTVGNLATLLMTKLFAHHGHKPILLVGGATSMIGDPSDKDDERKLLSEEEIAKNKVKIAEEFRRIMFGVDVEIVDNYDWFKNINYLEFLRDVGKNFSMTNLLQRDYVSKRIGAEGRGMSYAEFSYTLIQGYDFLHLFREKGVTLQVCGSDQWGNSISGVELIRRLEGKEAHIWSAPLVINKTTGKKFGKTEDGAIWLDAEKTSPFQFYQFWINVDDKGAEDYLKIYTELDKDSINKTMEEFEKNKGARSAQKTLAYEVTKIVHGQDEAEKQQRITRTLFGETEETKLNNEELEVIRAEMSSIKVNPGTNLVEALVEAGLASSNSEARRLLAGGAVYVNSKKAEKDHLEKDDFKNGMLFLRRGKAFKDTALVELA